MDILEQNQTNEQQTNTQSQTTPPAVPPSTWLITAILTTIFCCMPFGLAGVVYAARVEPYFLAGKYTEAEMASRNAKKWTLIGIAIAVVWWILYVAFFASMFATYYNHMD
ncbi:MAG: CD225/dispanin family protein [Phocaeicola sp.]|jgi:hypothetical protein|nr:CD225/dispanin family protein [Phocaeicola sp.]